MMVLLLAGKCESVIDLTSPRWWIAKNVPTFSMVVELLVIQAFFKARGRVRIVLGPTG
jgi:hypothetical protein